MGVPVADVIQIPAATCKSLIEPGHLPLVIRNKFVAIVRGVRARTNQTGNDAVDAVHPSEQQSTSFKGTKLLTLSQNPTSNLLREPQVHAAAERQQASCGVTIPVSHKGGILLPFWKCDRTATSQPCSSPRTRAIALRTIWSEIS